jgi:hypothetical protein
MTITVEMVLLLDFKEGSDAELVSNTQIKLIRTKDVPAYKQEEAEVIVVEEELHAFIVAMSAAKSGGTEEKRIRDEQRTELEASLEALGNALIAHANGNPLYVTDTTFKLRQSEGGQTRQPLEAPRWNYLRRGVLSGTLSGEVANLPKGARGLMVQWRIVGDEQYTMAQPSNGKRITLSGLPILVKVEVRVRFFGTHNRMSDWSIPYPIDVV